MFISISTSAKNIEHVKFWLNDPVGEGQPFNIDRWPPFDLLGRKHKRHNMRPMAFDTTRRENGEHSILIEFLFTDETSARMLTPFTIFNEANIPFLNSIINNVFAHIDSPTKHHLRRPKLAGLQIFVETRL